MKPVQNHAFIFLFVLFSSQVQAQMKVDNKDLKILVDRMQGTFNTANQSKADTNFFHISLQMKPIWKERKDGYWLYVEQAMAKAPEKPYRQRVYHVRLENDTIISSTVYELPKPARFVGSWKDGNPLANLSKDSLVTRQGCAIYLKKNKDGDFWGSTPGKECLSALRGATYATSEVTIYKNLLISWDRGYDASDKQVWGSTMGGYRFEKQ